MPLLVRNCGTHRSEPSSSPGPRAGFLYERMIARGLCRPTSTDGTGTRWLLQPKATGAPSCLRRRFAIGCAAGPASAATQVRDDRRKWLVLQRHCSIRVCLWPGAIAPARLPVLGPWPALRSGSACPPDASGAVADQDSSHTAEKYSNAPAQPLTLAHVDNPS
jgi:hypothetical protein